MQLIQYTAKTTIAQFRALIADPAHTLAIVGPANRRASYIAAIDEYNEGVAASIPQGIKVPAHTPEQALENAARAVAATTRPQMPPTALTTALTTDPLPSILEIAVCALVLACCWAFEAGQWLGANWRDRPLIVSLIVGVAVVVPLRLADWIADRAVAAVRRWVLLAWREAGGIAGITLLAGL
jgi:hypothetical protein